MDQVALLVCPMPEIGYEAWIFDIQEKSINNKTIHLSLGTPNPQWGDTGIGNIAMILMYDGEIWENSCQLYAVAEGDNEIDQAVFDTFEEIYDSVS